MQVFHSSAPVDSASPGRSVCPQSHPHLHPKHTDGPLPTSSGLVLCHCMTWRGNKSLLRACLGFLATLYPAHGHTCAVLADSSFISSSYTGYPHQLWMKEQGCAEQGTWLLLVPNPWLSSHPPTCPHPKAAPTQESEDPRSAQISWAVPPVLY